MLDTSTPGHLPPITAWAVLIAKADALGILTPDTTEQTTAAVESDPTGGR